MRADDMKETFISQIPGLEQALSHRSFTEREMGMCILVILA